MTQELGEELLRAALITDTKVLALTLIAPNDTVTVASRSPAKPAGIATSSVSPDAEIPSTAQSTLLGVMEPVSTANVAVRALVPSISRIIGATKTAGSL
jgi:hypothetical protein